MALRIIIEHGGDCACQIDAAEAAIAHGLAEGDVIGFRINGDFYSVKRNKRSIRVYPQAAIREGRE